MNYLLRSFQFNQNHKGFFPLGSSAEAPKAVSFGMPFLDNGLSSGQVGTFKMKFVLHVCYYLLTCQRNQDQQNFAFCFYMAELLFLA